MKKLPYLFAAFVCAILALSPACSTDDDDATLWDTYSEWRENNTAWLTEQQMRTDENGNNYYSVIIPAWNPDAFVLIHYFNDTTLTRDNLVPMYTSTVDVRYKGYYYNETPLDSSTLQTAYGPGIFRTQLNSVVSGWAIALETMHVGDSAEIIIPYQQAYGASSTTTVPPYSNLRFNVRLVDIYAYEINPK